MAALIKVLFILAISIYAALAIKCMECTDMPDPQDCTTTTECSAYETCHVTQFITTGGLVLYNSGCIAKTRCTTKKRDVGDVLHKRQDMVSPLDILTCVACCDTEFCNLEGCGITSMRMPQRGPVCFSCAASKDPKTCRDVQTCTDTQVCSLFQHYVGPHLVYTSKCDEKRRCISFNGRRGLLERSSFCFKCCTDDFCNQDCGPSTHLTTPSPATTTPVTTKPTTNLQTTKPTTKIPITTKLTTKIPTTTKLTTKIPITNKPTKMPITTKLTTKIPTTTKLTTKIPITNKPTKMPITTKPITKIPITTTNKPATTKITTNNPKTTVKTTTNKPATTRITNKPATTKQITNKSATTKISNKPATTKPTTNNPATTKQTTPKATPTTPALPITTKDPETACKKQNYIYDSHLHLCLKFHTNPRLNWTEALHECEKDNGTLAVITSDAKTKDVQNFIASHSSSQRTAYWVGANDQTQSHVFTWLSGETTVLQGNTTIDLTQASCLFIDGPTQADLKFESCKEKHAYICEKKNQIKTRSAPLQLLPV